MAKSIVSIAKGMVFTCALKNIKGVVQDKVHYQMHQTDLYEQQTLRDFLFPANPFTGNSSNKGINLLTPIKQRRN